MIVIIPLAKCIKHRSFVNEKDRKKKKTYIGKKTYTQLILELICVQEPIKGFFFVLFDIVHNNKA